jgi:hypothetical protein
VNAPVINSGLLALVAASQRFAAFLNLFTAYINHGTAMGFTGCGKVWLLKGTGFSPYVSARKQVRL